MNKTQNAGAVVCRSKVTKLAAGHEGHVLLEDLRQENVEAAAKVLDDAGYEGSTTNVDVSSRASVHALAKSAARWMIELCPVERAGTPDEVCAVGASLMGRDGAFMTGSDFLMDGGVTAAYWYGELGAK